MYSEAVDFDIHEVAAPNDLHASKQGLERQMVEMVAQEWQLCVGRSFARELQKVRVRGSQAARSSGKLRLKL